MQGRVDVVVPIVFDRAMGSAGAVARLCKSELRFLAAVRRSEVHSYTKELPSETLCDCGGSEDEVERPRLTRTAAPISVVSAINRPSRSPVPLIISRFSPLHSCRSERAEHEDLPSCSGT